MGYKYWSHLKYDTVHGIRCFCHLEGVKWYLCWVCSQLLMKQSRTYRKQDTVRQQNLSVKYSGTFLGVLSITTPPPTSFPATQFRQMEKADKSLLFFNRTPNNSRHTGAADPTSFFTPGATSAASSSSPANRSRNFVVLLLRVFVCDVTRDVLRSTGISGVGTPPSPCAQGRRTSAQVSPFDLLIRPRAGRSHVCCCCDC